jgi:hypothetical protein
VCDETKINWVNNFDSDKNLMKIVVFDKRRTLCKERLSLERGINLKKEWKV